MSRLRFFAFDIPGAMIWSGAFLGAGAIPIALDELEDRHPEIPRDRDIIVYCT